MQLPYSDELNIEQLGRLFDKKSECYKLFWFKAIVAKITSGKNELSYEELVDEMISDAWYMVTEYHLNLGPKDNLESVVDLIKLKYPSLKSCENKQVLLDFLHNTNDKDITVKKRILSQNVPYRIQVPLFESIKSKDLDTGEEKCIDLINTEKRLMYYFLAFNGLATRIVVQEDWGNYIVKNQEIIRGWIEYNMIKYLQRRNPNVPGIADKLFPPQERKLEKVKKYWRLITSIEPIHEIYNNTVLTEKDISIDHFVPWSYVAHDELWNLNPTTKSINSSKSNNLPDWDSYFNRLACLEYKSYQMLWKYESVHKEFDRCAKEHINNNDVRFRIYREGLGRSEFTEGLKALVLPAYESARNNGFKIWKYEDRICL